MNKNFFFCILFSVLFLGNINAQRHEIGVQLGTSNLVGDIGKTSYINVFPGNTSNISNEGIPFYAAVLYRMNFNPHQTLRFNASYNHIQFNDSYAKETYRRQRKLWGSNSIYELAAIFEYNLFPVNNEQRSLLSPYVFGGFSGMLANVTRATLVNDFNRNANGVAIAPTSATDFVTNATYTNAKKITMAIPFGIGLKYKFKYNWAIFGEFMFRPTFSDAIDYSVVDQSDLKISYNKDILASGTTKSLLQTGDYLIEAEKRAQDFLEQRQVGNTNSKDWVNTISLGLSYSFGRPPCYCD